MFSAHMWVEYGLRARRAATAVSTAALKIGCSGPVKPSPMKTMSYFVAESPLRSTSKNSLLSACNSTFTAPSAGIATAATTIVVKQVRVFMLVSHRDLIEEHA